MLKDLRYFEYFLFTQQSLATFSNCPLKFKKRYLENLKWNGVFDESVKKRLELGNDFHLMAHRYFMGIDIDSGELYGGNTELEEWVSNLKKYFKLEPGTMYLPEHKLRLISNRLKLEANFDLLMVRDGAIQVWDWKTRDIGGEPKKARDPKKYTESLQTMVYMYVLKELSSIITGHDIEARKISMTYWQPSPPSVIARIVYSDRIHEAFGAVIEKKVRDVLRYDYQSFDIDLYKKHCKYCEFNWFCNNEKLDPATLDDGDDDFIDDIDWENVEEVF